MLEVKPCELPHMDRPVHKLVLDHVLRCHQAQAIYPFVIYDNFVDDHCFLRHFWKLRHQPQVQKMVQSNHVHQNRCDLFGVDYDRSHSQPTRLQLIIRHANIAESLRNLHLVFENHKTNIQYLDCNWSCIIPYVFLRARSQLADKWKIQD